jgi:hypothetical protein
MVADDVEPFSIVECTGFQHLMKQLEPRYDPQSHCYLSDTTLPQLYASVKEVVQKELDAAKYVSCTTDIWMANYVAKSYTSLTAHWIMEDFPLKMVVLHVEEFPDHQSADNIAATLDLMLDKSGLREKLHAVLHDNTTNAVAASRDSGTQCAALNY